MEHFQIAILYNEKGDLVLLNETTVFLNFSIQH